MTSQLGWTILSGTERGRCVSFLSLNISDENSEFRKLLINKSTLGSKLGPPQLSGRAMWVGQAWILIWVTKPVPAWAWARTGLGACRVQLCKRCTRKCYRKSLQNRNRVWKLGKRKTKLSCIRRLVRKTKTKNEATILKVNSYENENEKRRSPNS